MGQAGRFLASQFGYSVPVDSPLYQPLPIAYRRVRMMLFDYLTEASLAAALLPEPLELLDVQGHPDLALVKLLFAEYPFTTLGPYNEVAQVLPCSYNGAPLLYAVRLHVTSDAAMAAGREIAGFPKKIGHIEFRKDESFFCSLERPRGMLICNGAARPESHLVSLPLKPGAAPKLPEPFNQTLPLPPVGQTPMPLILPFVSLRHIPDPHGAAQTSQLVETTWLLETGDLWAAKGSCHFTGASTFDPYHKLPILDAPLDCLLFEGDMQITKDITVLKSYS